MNVVDAVLAMGWAARSDCRGLPTERWFTDPGDPEAANAAISVCARCPVQAECLTYALLVGERHGIWGGKSEKQRAKIRQRFHRLGAVRNRRLCERCGMWFVVESLNSPAEMCGLCAEEHAREVDRLRDRRAG